MDYQIVKDWLAQKENKQKFLTGLCFLLVFLVGFGTGKSYNSSSQTQKKLQNNYTTKTPAVPINQTAEEGIAQVLSASTTSTSADSNKSAVCIIKGNISAKGKIYHIPGGASYKITKAEMCFSTEAEAQAAGFVKASR